MNKWDRYLTHVNLQLLSAIDDLRKLQDIQLIYQGLVDIKIEPKKELLSTHVFS